MERIGDQPFSLPDFSVPSLLLATGYLFCHAEPNLMQREAVYV